MPLYDFKCKKCGHILIDVEHGINDEMLIQCPECLHNWMTQQISGGAAGIVRNSPHPYRGK